MNTRKYPELDYNVISGFDLIDADLPENRIAIEDILVGLSTGVDPLSFARNIVLKKYYQILTNTPQIFFAALQNARINTKWEKVRINAAEYISKAYNEFVDIEYSQWDIKHPILRMITSWEKWIKQHPEESMQLFPAWASVKHYVEITGIDNNIPEDIKPLISHEFYFKTFEDAYSLSCGKAPKNYKDLFPTNQAKTSGIKPKLKEKNVIKETGISQEKGYSLPSGGGIGEFSISFLPDNYGMEDDILSSLNVPIDVSSLLGESGAFNLPETLLLPSSAIQGGSGGETVGSGFSLFPGSVGSLGSLFGMGEGISIPLQYKIEVKGLEQFEGIKEKAEEVGEAFDESRNNVNSFSSEMMKQFLNLKEEQRAALSVDMAMLPLNIMGIGGAPFQFSMPTEESKEFSETLSDIASIAGQLGGAFMNVNESIGKAIGSAGGFAGGISNVLSALKMNPLEGKDISKMTPEQIESAREQGEKQKELALMGGIQGAFGGLQGLFGGEAGSDTSQLLGGFGGGMVKFQRII